MGRKQEGEVNKELDFIFSSHQNTTPAEQQSRALEPAHLVVL